MAPYVAMRQGKSLTSVCGGEWWTAENKGRKRRCANRISKGAKGIISGKDCVCLGRVCMKNAWEACVGRGVPNNRSAVLGQSAEPVSVLTLLFFVSLGLCKRTQSETLMLQF